MFFFFSMCCFHSLVHQTLTLFWWYPIDLGSFAGIKIKKVPSSSQFSVLVGRNPAKHFQLELSWDLSFSAGRHLPEAQYCGTHCWINFKVEIAKWGTPLPIQDRTPVCFSGEPKQGLHSYKHPCGTSPKLQERIFFQSNHHPGHPERQGRSFLNHFDVHIWSLKTSAIL